MKTVTMKPYSEPDVAPVVVQVDVIRNAVQSMLQDMSAEANDIFLAISSRHRVNEMRRRIEAKAGIIREVIGAGRDFTVVWAEDETVEDFPVEFPIGIDYQGTRYVYDFAKYRDAAFLTAGHDHREAYKRYVVHTLYEVPAETDGGSDSGFSVDPRFFSDDN